MSDQMSDVHFQVAALPCWYIDPSSYAAIVGFVGCFRPLPQIIAISQFVLRMSLPIWHEYGSALFVNGLMELVR
jgi:hypothetical protein